MKQKRYISFAYGPRMPETFFDAAGFKTGEYEPCPITRTADTYIAAEDPRGPRLMELLREAGIKPFHRLDVTYSRLEILSADYVCFGATFNGKGFSGPDQDIEFDMSTACPACGTAARQASALRLKRSDLPKKRSVSCTYSAEYLLRRDLVMDLMISLKSERGLRQVEERKTHAKLDWWQIIPDTDMPKMDPTTTGITTDQQCAVCRRDGHYNDMSQPFCPTYRMSPAARGELPDFVSTWERFLHTWIRKDQSRVLGFAQPGLLISHKVTKFLLERRIPRLALTPVRFV
jgi:hypothetical protein